MGSIQRRIVLDAARKKLFVDYPNDANYKLANESVELVHSALSQEHKNLLSIDALRMVFDTFTNGAGYPISRQHCCA
jgi:hypothetical protein